jgi:beta-phosphoglucomutase-like phosphatase (HAD superfamily)
MNISQKKLLILDMNSTFVFGEDRFGENEDYSTYYKSIGGQYSKGVINDIITDVYEHLEVQYTNETCMECFPSVHEAIHAVCNINDKKEIEYIVQTFAFHERGDIPHDYVKCLHRLSKHFMLAAVIDIWAPSQAWVELFKEKGIYSLFQMISFSSDIKTVKPSVIPFHNVLEHLNIKAHEALMIGDSIKRDFCGAKKANIDCIIVGEQKTSHALACYESLLEFEKMIR